ncbi:MAG: hypothetical protein NZO16_07575, partial [Deltaproteobacteria bacterium]|nr:hypothetical protein [Deltaproteobacteria bacterium]
KIMQRGSLVILIHILSLCAQQTVEILPISTYTAVNIIQKEKLDSLKKGIAFFSLGLDKKALEISERVLSENAIDLNSRLEALILKVLAAYRLREWGKCCEAVLELQSFNADSNVIKNLQILCNIQNAKSEIIPDLIASISDSNLLAEVFEFLKSKDDLSNLITVFARMPESEKKMKIGDLSYLLLKANKKDELKKLEEYLTFDKNQNDYVQAGLNIVKTDSKNLGDLQDSVEKLGTTFAGSN